MLAATFLCARAAPAEGAAPEAAAAVLQGMLARVQAAAREMLEEGGNPKGRSDKAKLKRDKTLAPVRV